MSRETDALPANKCQDVDIILILYSFERELRSVGYCSSLASYCGYDDARADEAIVLMMCSQRDINCFERQAQFLAGHFLTKPRSAKPSSNLSVEFMWIGI